MPGKDRREDLRGEIDEAFEHAKKAVKAVKDKFDECMDHLSGWKVTVFIPAPVLVWVKQKMEEVAKRIKKLIALVEYAVEHYTPVVSLIYQSFNWLDSVKTPISDMSAPATQPRDQELYYWEGAAAAAYQQKAGDQQKAIDDITAKADFISQWLFKIAKTNVDYMVELADFAAAFAGALVQATVDTATIADIPWAVDALASQTGALVEQQLKMLVDIGQQFVDALGDVRDIASDLGDHSALSDGHWPQAIAG
jgi:hypothetical protein